MTTLKSPLLPFTDAQEMAIKHPAKFYAPDQAELDAIKPGYFVKACTGSERFWFKVDRINDDGTLAATVSSDLLCTDEHGLSQGDQVQLERRFIYDFGTRLAVTGWDHFDLGCWPWNEPAARADVTQAKDCNLIWHDGTDVLLFHVTSESAAREILQSGPRETSTPIGFDRREPPPGFWCNCVPFVPYAVEQWMPHIDQGEIDVLAVVVDSEILADRYHFDSSWPFAQFGLRAEDVKHIERVPAYLFPQFRSEADRTSLAEYLHNDGNYLSRSRYVAELAELLAAEVA